MISPADSVVSISQAAVPLIMWLPKLTLMFRSRCLTTASVGRAKLCTSMVGVSCSCVCDGSQAGNTASAATQTLQRRSEEHTSELQSLMRLSYDGICLKKKKYRTRK